MIATVPLDGSHDCDAFVCNRSDRVTRFLKTDRHRLAVATLAKIFVLVSPSDPTKILGYYCLSAGQISREWVSNRLGKELPRPIAPMAILGFMGRDDSAPPGTGKILLADAALRVADSSLAAWGIMLHAENEKLMAWYSAMGFKTPPPGVLPLNDDNKRLMYAPIRSLLPPSS